MKKTVIILVLIVINLAAGYSFKKAGEGEENGIAIMSYQLGKENSDDGYLVTYSNGTKENFPFANKVTKEGRVEQQFLLTNIISGMYKKGYHLIVVNGNYTIFGK